MFNLIINVKEAHLDQVKCKFKQVRRSVSTYSGIRCSQESVKPKALFYVHIEEYIKLLLLQMKNYPSLSGRILALINVINIHWGLIQARKSMTVAVFVKL